MVVPVLKLLTHLYYLCAFSLNIYEKFKLKSTIHTSTRMIFNYTMLVSSTVYFLVFKPYIGPSFTVPPFLYSLRPLNSLNHSLNHRTNRNGITSLEIAYQIYNMVTTNLKAANRCRSI